MITFREAETGKTVGDEKRGFLFGKKIADFFVRMFMNDRTEQFGVNLTAEGTFILYRITHQGEQNDQCCGCTGASDDGE